MSYSDIGGSYHVQPGRVEPLSSTLATIVAAILLTTLLISFQPFAASERISEVPVGPSSINQIGFSALGLLAVFGMTMLADRRRLAGVLDVAWLPVIACLLLAAANTGDPAGATRSVLFTLIVVITCAGVLVIPHSAIAFRRTTATALIIVLVVSYVGIFLLPGSAIHGSGGAEAQHDGLWRGVFSHKNVAGPVMATFLFFGIYLLRAGDRWKGFFILALAAIFILQTGSKTTNGMIPLAIGAVFIGRLFASRWLPPALVVTSVTFAGFFTVGTVVWPALGEILAQYLDDPTFTGRTALWAYGLENIAKNPWTGYGFDNFWLKPIVTDAFLPIDADWDYRDIVNGHNNYIDMALFLGLPAAAIVIFVLCIRPLIDYLRCRPGPENRRLADLFLMILAFVLLNSMLESSWFRRADPTWVMMVIAILGLRMTARQSFRRDGR